VRIGPVRDAAGLIWINGMFCMFCLLYTIGHR
jgi:hypothetical protein